MKFLLHWVRRIVLFALPGCIQAIFHPQTTFKPPENDLHCDTMQTSLLNQAIPDNSESRSSIDIFELAFSMAAGEMVENVLVLTVLTFVLNVVTL